MRKSNEHVLSDSIKHRDPNDLKPPTRQITKPSAGKIAKLAKKMARLGFHTPILIDKENIVVTGWARVLAAHKLELPTIPTLCHEHLSPEHLRAIRVSDNFGNGDSAVEWESLAQELAELNALGFDSYDMGFDTAELDRLQALVTAPLEEEDAAPDEPSGAPVSRTDDLWQSCQVNCTRFCLAFDVPVPTMPPPCSRRIPSVRAGHALRRGSADAAGC